MCLVVLQSVDMAGHNTSLFVLGVMILWFGWYGFNPGSQLAIVTPTGSTYSIASAVSNAAVTTSLAPAAAGLTGLFVTAILLKLKTGKHHWDIMAMGNSTLAGLVAITAGCSTVYPWAAITIGIVAGFIYPLASRLMVLIRVCSRTLLETAFSLTCSVTNNFMWLLGGHWFVDAIFWMCRLKKLEVHYAEPLNVYYKKHLHVHACVAQGYCACMLLSPIVHAIVTSRIHLNLRRPKSAVLTVLCHVAD